MKRRQSRDTSKGMKKKEKPKQTLAQKMRVRARLLGEDQQKPKTFTPTMVVQKKKATKEEMVAAVTPKTGAAEQDILVALDLAFDSGVDVREVQSVREDLGKAIIDDSIIERLLIAINTRDLAAFKRVIKDVEGVVFWGCSDDGGQVTGAKDIIALIGDEEHDKIAKLLGLEKKHVEIATALLEVDIDAITMTAIFAIISRQANKGDNILEDQESMQALKKLGMEREVVPRIIEAMDRGDVEAFKEVVREIHDVT